MERAMVEVLVATIRQFDFSKYEKMNLKSDAVFANQAEGLSCEIQNIDGFCVKMVTTPTRGAGVNRNIALDAAAGDICLLADDDMTYAEGYAELVKEAFRTLPQADIIIFNISTFGRGAGRRTNKKIGRVRAWNFANYGSPRIAFRRESVRRNGIRFSALFGPGSKYSHGEDTLFLREALRKKLKIYTYPANIAVVDQTTSTWFTGYDEKYLFDKGALLSALFPVFGRVIALYFALKSSVWYKKNVIWTYCRIVQGIRGYEKGMDYAVWNADAL